MIRVHIIEPPTNAPAAILRTTGKMKASTGDRSTKMYLIFTVPQRICLCRKVRYQSPNSKRYSIKIETMVFPPEGNHSNALLNTPE